MSLRHRVASAIAASLLVACASDPLYLGPREGVAYDPEGRVDYTVTECGAQALLFIPFFNNNRARRALRAIQERAGDRYLAEIRIRERWMYLVFGTIHCTEMIAATFSRERGDPPGRAAED
jgi:hypothetical protein